MPFEWREFSDRNALATALASAVADDLHTAVGEHRNATLAVSGGSSPVALFTALAATPLPWRNINVLPADERWVPEDHPDSNAGLIHRHLLQGEAAIAEFTGLHARGDTPADGLKLVKQHLDSLRWPLDVIVLGMGLDGHTASLFPDAPELPHLLTTPTLCGTATPPSQPQARMSLSASAINSARHRYLLLQGQDKRDVFESAAEPGPVEAMPIRAILNAPEAWLPLQVYWAP